MPITISAISLIDRGIRQFGAGAAELASTWRDAASAARDSAPAGGDPIRGIATLREAATSVKLGVRIARVATETERALLDAWA